MNKAHTYGILQTQVVLVPGSHVTLFVPAQKNDKLSQGLFVTLAWISGSGVLNGARIQRLLSRLWECDLQRPIVPLFLPTIGNLGCDRSPFTGRRESNPRHGAKGHSYDDTFISLGCRSTYRIRSQSFYRSVGIWSCRRTTPRRQYGDSEFVEATRYAAPGEAGCFFPPARHVSGDRLADAPFLFESLRRSDNSREIQKFFCIDYLNSLRGTPSQHPL